MKLTDTWLNSLYLTHLVFLYTKTAKAKTERAFIKSTTLIYRTQRFFMILWLFSNPAEKAKNPVRAECTALSWNTEGLHQFMFKEMLLSSLLILSHKRWDLTQPELTGMATLRSQPCRSGRSRANCPEPQSCTSATRATICTGALGFEILYF